MSNISYDLDTSGGLMPLIRALIKPPDEEPNVPKPKKPQHPYYKRPGKGHNHDSCDACGEGGDLICCDRCPASFHLGCYDPPLDENDIPAGLWLCRECRGSDAEKPTSSRSSRAQSPADNKSDGEKKTRSLRNKKSKDDAEDELSKELEKEKEKELSPMEVLVKAARIMNPKQFELPREMRVPCLFPGTEKDDSKNGQQSLVTVDGAGCVPLPAVSCHVCRLTCKYAPLLQCDYCPLLFHQDCLDPPLTALPTGRWMCPNHVEQYIDWKLVNSISATQRVALWEQFSGPVDQHAIKIDFIRRARRANPSFRVRVPVGVRGRVMVPGMVRWHYARPPPLLPSRREHVRCRNVLKEQPAALAPVAEAEEGPKHTICMNAQCGLYRGGTCAHAHLRAVQPQDTDDDLRAIRDAKMEKSSDSSELSDSDFEYLTASVKRRKVQEKRQVKEHVKLELLSDSDAASLLLAVDSQLSKLDERLVKLLAWQRLQQVVVGEQAYGSGRGCPLSPRAERLVRRSIDRASLARFGFRHVALPSELLSRTERDRISRTVWGGRGGGGGCGRGWQGGGGAAHARARSPGAGHSLSDVAVRATVVAVQRPNENGLGDGLGRAIPMRLSWLTVGSDSGCDVPLDATVCRNVSRRHAVIFCDEVTRHFELINYSEYGSRVNGVMYACDLTPHQPSVEPRAPGDLTDLLHQPQPTVKAIRSERDSLCGCVAGSSGAAWEGAALLPHGALLQFGCLMFVFCITEPPPSSPAPELDHDKRDAPAQCAERA